MYEYSIEKIKLERKFLIEFAIQFFFEDHLNKRGIKVMNKHGAVIVILKSPILPFITNHTLTAIAPPN